eukprot:847961_1
MPTKHFYNEPEWNALMLSLAFYFLFGAFNTIQSYATSYYPKIGSFSFEIFYCVSVFSAPFAPMIIHYLDFKYSLLLAFIAYSTYNASYLMGNNIFYLCASFLCGFMAPTMWTCQGSYLTQCCNVFEYQHKIQYNSQIGWFKGLFYSFFAWNTTTGYLFAALYFEFDDSNHRFFFICTVISYASCIFILFFKYMPQQKYIQSINVNETKHNQLLSRNDPDHDALSVNHAAEKIESSHEHKTEIIFCDIVCKGWTDLRLQCLIVLIMYGGVLVSSIFGEFPSLITDTRIKFYAMSCYGIFGTVFAYIAGKVSDAYSPVPVTVIAAVLNVIVYGAILYGEFYGFDHFCSIIGLREMWVWILLAALLGMSGPIIQQMISVLVATLLGNKPIVFAKRSLLSGIPAAAGFFYHPYLSLEIKMIVNITFCVLGVLMLFIYPANRSIQTHNDFL